MQKLEGKLKNAPRDAPQVPCSVSSALNRLLGESVSVRGKVRTSNNPDVDLRVSSASCLTGNKKLIYVLSKEGIPLMPTKRCGAVRRWIRSGKAKVVNMYPFTVQLLWDCENHTQPITLGIDAGYSKIGFSAVMEKQELISGEVQLRKDISKKLTERRMYRRQKRNKLWYREARWQNRVASKKDGWLAPSIRHKLDSHIRLIDKIKSLLPISNVIVEVASFDTQKMVNPEISGVEYQQGTLPGYEIREYLLEKFNRTCVYCGKKNVPLEIEHIIPRSRGGNNRVSNLTLSCNKCNLKKGNKTAEEFGYPEVQKQAQGSLKTTAFMNNIRWQLVDILGCKWTFGYKTKHDRIKLGLEKSYSNDAFVITGGTNQQRIVPLFAEQHRRNNRGLQLNRKGFKPSVRRQRYKLQPFNIVSLNKQLFEVAGVHCRGRNVMLKNGKSVNITKVRLYLYMRGWQFISRINSGVSLP